jgi:hypothetical protein
MARRKGDINKRTLKKTRDQRNKALAAKGPGFVKANIRVFEDDSAKVLLRSGEKVGTGGTRPTTSKKKRRRKPNIGNPAGTPVQRVKSRKISRRA